MRKVAAAIFLILSGMFMSAIFFMSVIFIMGWGYSYLSCGILWTLSGFVWMWRPSLGARFGAIPVLGTAALMAPLFLSAYREHAEWIPIFWLCGSQVLCLAIALSLIITTIRKTSVPNFTPWIISFSLVFGSFLLNRAFVDRLTTKTYQANVALDGKGPWPFNDPSSDGSDAVFLYRNGRNGVVCYDGFDSKELHDFLLSKNGQSVTVEYDTFTDFGKVRGYNVHSVDGKILANGYHVLKPEFASSTGVARAGSGTASGEDCW
jgi:hypothetical protein